MVLQIIFVSYSYLIIIDWQSKLLLWRGGICYDRKETYHRWGWRIYHNNKDFYPDFMYISLKKYTPYIYM